MPGKVKVKVLAGRNLPVMDRGSDTTDAFVEIKFGSVTHKTDICRKSLNPHWNNSEWYRFEVEDSELQDEPLQLRLMDHDTYSANDAIGKVVVSLAPLLAREPSPTPHRAASHNGAVMSGWIPVFDTMHGIRGELNIIVKVELFSDFNKFRQSSCGVQFFHCPKIPCGYHVAAIHGFVEELVVNDDPEYQWIDKIRTPRASNEARQVAFIKLSNQVQRRVGLKASELGANAVVGYSQAFDLQGEAGVVARAAATAVTLVRALPPPHLAPSLTLAHHVAPDVNPAQQPQLQKYLKFLTGDYNSQTDLNNYYQSHHDQMYKMMSILAPNLSNDYPDERDQRNVPEPYDDVAQDAEQYSSEGNIPGFCESQSPSREYPALQILPPADTEAVYNLLEQEDARLDKSLGPLTRGIKQLRVTSQNMIPKSITNMRGKRLPSQISDDQISIKSNSSDSSRISLTELRAEFRKLKKFRRPKFRRSSSGQDESGGSGMVSVLVRSVMHAHSSLACIAETQDSDSPSSTLHRSSEAKPNINLSRNKTSSDPIIVIGDELKNVSIENIQHSEHAKAETVQFSTLSNVRLDLQEAGELQAVSRTSESCPSSPVTLGKNEIFLKLPGDVGYFGSMSSALSGDSSEAYSTSEDEMSESSSFPRTDTEISLNTISAVVKSVLESHPDPAFIAHMEERLELSKSRNRTPSESRVNTDTHTSTVNQAESEKTMVDLQKIKAISDQEKYKKTGDYHSDPEDNVTRFGVGFKFSNPFTKMLPFRKSVSVPSSPVQRNASLLSSSSVHIKRQLSKLSKKRIIKSFSHNALPESMNQVKYSVKSKALSSNVSHSDIKSLGESYHNSACKMTVLGSPFMSFLDLINLNRERNMESPTSFYAKHYEENPPRQAEMFIGSEPSSRMSFSGPSSPSYALSGEATPQDLGSFQFAANIKKAENETRQDTATSLSPTSKKPSGLLQRAMETILIDKINALMVPSHEPLCDDPNSKTKFLSDVNKKLCDYETFRNKSIHRRFSDQTDRVSKRKLMRQDSVKSDTSISSTVLDTEINISELRDSLQKIPNNLLELPSAILIPREYSHKLTHTLTTIPSLPENSSFEGCDTKVPFDKTKDLCDKCEHADLESNEHPAISEHDFNHYQSSQMSTNLNETCTDNSTYPDYIVASTRVCNNSHAVCCVPSDRSERCSSPRQHSRTDSAGAAANYTPIAVVCPPSTTAGVSVSVSAPIGMNRRSSDSDLSITPKGNSLTMTGGAILRPSMNPNNLEMLEYPFLTMDEFPPGFVIHIGGTVCARSVKLVERSEGAGGGEAAWWAELRTELRAHARALRCTAVLGYSEAATICEDVCILSASGTAAVINLEPASFVPFNTVNGAAPNTQSGTQKSTMTRADSESEHCSSATRKETQSNGDRQTEHNADVDWNYSVEEKPGCSIAHVPYNHQSMPYQADVTKCCVCRRSRVPRILICTVELPCGLATVGRGCLVTAAAARIRRAPPTGEPAARDLSDQLPFLEYELHRLLVAKLRVLGMNALFGLRVSVSAGERLVVALASGTAVLCSALPTPRAPRLAGQADAIAELQRALDQALETNKSVYELEPNPSTLNSDDSDDDLPDLELTGDKNACVLEVDDAEDIEMARALASGRAPRGVHAVSVRRAPHLASVASPHAFTQLWRARVSPTHAPGGHAACVSRHVHRLMQSVYYKLRRLTPCVVCDIKFQLDLPEVDEIQLLVTGVALPLPTEPIAILLPEPVLHHLHTPHTSHNGAGDELVFTLDDEDEADRHKHQPDEKLEPWQSAVPQRACGVAVTPLERVCGARSQRHVSALRLLFVRETTSVRELGGISGFLHTFVMEVLAVARAYCTALGGNALSSFYITELMLQDNPHKNQGQCLLSVGGDVVFVT